MTDSLIYESHKSKVFRRIGPHGESYAVKVLNYEFPTPEDISRFHNEFDILQGLGLSGVRNVVEKARENGRHVLVMQWVKGQPLKDVFRGKSDHIEDALHIAIACAAALAEIHENRIVHKDITPNNLIVDLQERQVHLIDFGISTNLKLKQPYVGNPALIEGTLAYVSPEQTGRMNRTVDYRSDLYSFGVTLYEMLTGDVPFSGMDTIETVHAHLAQMPVPAHEINPEVPEALSNIVDRLLAKNADERYQSARGLKFDLEKCLAVLQSEDPHAPFELGQRDYASVFRLPHKLYGRETEVNDIIYAFDKAADGARNLLLVEGYSGVGKTALVHEVHKPITARRGYFCSGKFDQLQRATPYFAFLEAFGELIDMLLTQDEETLSGLRDQLREALGDEGRVLTNVFKNLELIIGKQPPVAEVGGMEAQNRFFYVFRKFLRVLATEDHPVVIFVDDLQWADLASLALLQSLMTDPESGHLLMICAYRANEVGPTHAFIRTVDEIADTGLIPHKIHVDNLSEKDLAALLSDALASSEQDVLPLAQLVHDKTSGNAFFATEFLKSLADEQLLHFNYTAERWVWDAVQIAQKNIAENIVDLVAEKVQRLEPAPREILELASCVGNRFDLETLCWIADADSETVTERLQPGLVEGLVLPVGKGVYKFSHDRVQQAVYSLIPKPARERVHLKIGRRLKSNITDANMATRVFDVVNQLNVGRALIDDADEVISLVELNLDAGRRSKLNSAFVTALDFLQCGISLLASRQDPWAEHYDLTLALYTEATEAAYLSGRFDLMDTWFDEILVRARTTLEMVKPYEIRILAFKAQNRFLDAIGTGLELLEALGEKFPRNPNAAHVFRDLAFTHYALRGRTNDDLMALPLMTDPEKRAAMRIIADITSSVYWGMPNLVPLIVFRMVRLSLKYGNHPVSCFAYGSYGVLLCGVLGSMREGYRYGHLALDLLEKLNAKEWKAQIYVTPYALIFHWNEHIRNTLRPLQQSFQIGMETGLIEFACVNTNIYCIQAYLCGLPLERVAEETAAYSKLYKQFGQETNYNYNQVFRQAMLNMIGRSPDPVKLTGEAYDEDVMLAQNQERSDKTGTFFIHFNKLMLCYYFRRYQDAWEHAKEARGLLDAVLAKFEIPNHYFYEALTAIALAENERGARRLRLLARARMDIAKLKRWSRFAPENYRHKYDLCAAELARIQGKTNVARLAYDAAIVGASENDYIHEQALACELAGRFYAESDRLMLAEFHLKAAYNTYREWGAGAKQRDLAEMYPKFLTTAGRQTGGTVGNSTADSMIDGSLLDIATLLKASTKISSEVVLSNLLTILMRIVLENAGAQRGLLLVESAKGLVVQAHGEASGEHLEVMQASLMEDYGGMLVPLIKFVHRTGEPVVVADAASDTRFKDQAYVQEHKTKSILCVPIVNRGRGVGVLYLENNLTIGAFTRDRVDLLTLLSGQIAVSIENAMLYEELELKVAERTAELAREKQKTDDLLLNILPAETAKELKQKGYADARHYDRATVLMTDFIGFTKLSSTLTPSELVQEIDDCFKAFDQIVEKHRVEKIKTVGDAFMAAGGLPLPNSTHAENVLRAALEMRDFMRDRRRSGNPNAMGIRIGVHSGPVVAGIVGIKKFQYDIWGDTVNIAARMESSGAPDEVNVSAETYNLVRNKFAFTYRGELEAKGKGRVPMYFADYLQDVQKKEVEHEPRLTEH